MRIFRIIDTLHAGECPDCMAAARQAMSHARVTGSIGGTFRMERVAQDGTQTLEHSATVLRVQPAEK